MPAHIPGFPTVLSNGGLRNHGPKAPGAYIKSLQAWSRDRLDTSEYGDIFELMNFFFL